MNASLDVKSQRLFSCILSALACLLVTGSKADELDKAKTSATDPMLGKKLGQIRDDNGLKMKLVTAWIRPYGTGRAGQGAVSADGKYQ